VNPAELRQRRQFDFQVLDAMRCDTFDFHAYASTPDLDHRRWEIVDAAKAGDASKYRFIMKVPTLIGAGRLSPETEIGVDVDVADYPIKEPNTWIISKKVPWSPHFRRGSPVCIGDEFWNKRRGHVTLGHLAIHLARLLNWDEKGRGPGYAGWNGAAIEYHQSRYKGQPLNPTIIYPILPPWLAGGMPDPPDPPFRVVRR
jgi:hypothetical protein